MSNFAPHRFVFEGIECACMEALLQSFKIRDSATQVEACGFHGPKAQSFGRKSDWTVEGLLWWKGEPIDRLSDAYQALLDRAFEALYGQAPKFRAALAATGQAELVHSLGKADPTETILTAQEFCSRLMRLRSRQT